MQINLQMEIYINKFKIEKENFNFALIALKIIDG